MKKADKVKNLLVKLIRRMFRDFYIILLCFPYSAMARDFLSSVENASGQIRQIIAVVGVLALMIAGVCFTGQKSSEWKSFLPRLSGLWCLPQPPLSLPFSIRLLTKQKREKNENV